MKLGRPKGTSDVRSRTLYRKDEQILELMDKDVPKSAIARILDVNRQTLQTYIDNQNLMFQLRARRMRKLSDYLK